MLATALLEKQHRKVEKIFKKLEGAPSNGEALVVELADDLAAHMVIEERIFYPAVRKLKNALVLEGYEEHAIARYALKRLLATSATDETFPAKVTALKELIADHIKEEEHELFPKVRKSMDEAQLVTLGKEMQTLFDHSVAAGYEAAMRGLDAEKKAKRPVAADGMKASASAR